MNRMALRVFFLFLLMAFPAMAAEKPVTYVGDQQIHVADEEDTLADLARDNNLGYVELRAANPDIDPWLPGEGTEILLPTRHLLPDAPQEGIVINLPEMRLFAFVNGDSPPSTYPIGIGREGLVTPTGRTSIVDKKEGPEWRPTKRMREEDPELPEVVPAGPENPLGTHALYLGWPTYRIHGTNKPYGIGRRVSSGCIRLYPEGIQNLYYQIPTGTPVTVVDQPVKVGWIEDTLYLEAHATTEQADQMEEQGEVSTYRMSEDDMRLILRTAGDDAENLDWREIRHVIRERQGYPVAIAKREMPEENSGADVEPAAGEENPVAEESQE